MGCPRCMEPHRRHQKVGGMASHWAPLETGSTWHELPLPDGCQLRWTRPDAMQEVDFKEGICVKPRKRGSQIIVGFRVYYQERRLGFDAVG